MAYDNSKMQDIIITEKQLWEQFANYWAGGNISSAIALLNTNQNLKYKVLNAFNWNRLCNLINDGTLSENWNNTTTYSQGQMTTNGNYVYASKTSGNIGNEPPNTTYWQQLYTTASATTPTTNSLVGQWESDYNDLETESANFKYIGNWSSTATYKKNNLVTSTRIDTWWSGKTNVVQTSYFAIQDVPAGELLTNTSYWIPAQQMLSSIGIQVSNTPPSNTSRVGDIYLQIVT